jgi:hypothetical protein
MDVTTSLIGADETLVPQPPQNLAPSFSFAPQDSQNII